VHKGSTLRAFRPEVDQQPDRRFQALGQWRRAEPVKQAFTEAAAAGSSS